jgi:hypothetical protein
MIWPDLVLSKIYWYLWKHNIQSVNQCYLYRYRSSWYSDSIYDNYTNDYINCRGLNDIYYPSYKYFIGNAGSDTSIHLPKKYRFSSGMHSLDGYK